MSQLEKAEKFKALHKKGEPLVLYNIWDAGGAKALSGAGASAVATGSWSVAAAHGYKDGELIPLDFVLPILKRISQTVDLPVSLDFEGGYAKQPENLTANASMVIKAGVVGINFEDRIVQGEGLYSISTQVKRIKAIRMAAQNENVPLFINARTDLFLASDPATHENHVAEAIEREAAYKEAGADGFFIPGLTDTVFIEKVIDGVSLPVNVMMMGGLDSIETVSKIGVSRASYGPAPYFSAMSDLTNRFNNI